MLNMLVIAVYLLAIAVYAFPSSVGFRHPSHSQMLETQAAPAIVPGSAGYVPLSLADANPATEDKYISLIPGASTDCQITPQTIAEVMNIRSDSAKLAVSIQTETQNCDARRRYIEHLTHFLNRWIFELNRLKRDLNSCDKYIELASKRIEQLSVKERLIKTEDVINCINVGKQGDDAWGKMQEEQKKHLTAQADSYKSKLKKINEEMQKKIKDEEPAAE